MLARDVHFASHRGADCLTLNYCLPRLRRPFIRRPVIDAVIRAGGKQYRVREGTVLEVATMVAEPGDRIELNDVLLISDGGQITVGSPNVANALVVVEVLEHGRGKKVINFKYKAKVRYRRKRGHRQGYTRLRIAEVRLGDKVAKASDRPSRPESDVGEAMATMTGATAAEDAIETTATAETPARTVPTGRRNRATRAAPEASTDTPVGEGMAEITGAEATEEVIEAQAESETPTGRRRRRATPEATGESSETESKD
jgi:large subunit ribosomal protein L21